MTLQPLDPQPKAILFDLDDTLCDYATAREMRLRTAFGRAIEACGRKREEIDIDRMIAASIALHPHGADHFPKLFSEFGIDSQAHALAAADWYRTNRFYGLKLFPEVGQVVRLVRLALMRRGSGAARPLGVVTNGPAEVQRVKLGLLHIEDLVDFAIISEEFGVEKPDPEIFNEALRCAAVSAQEAVFVGDSAEFDIAGAHGAGIATIWVNRYDLPWNVSRPPPTRQVRSLAELPPLLGFKG